MSADKNPDNPILSVSELNQYARGILEMHVGKITVTGEISNFSQPASGHWYFTLKDANAQIRCAIFRNKNQFLRIRPISGMQVIIQGSVSIYEGRGDYQLIADYLEESGIGALQKQFEQLKSKLSLEGLFDAKHKQPLPKHAKHIGVITSASGAVIHDILTVLNERFPAIAITVIPTAVQGTNAAEEICEAIALAERWNSENIDAIDILIVGRGGGSIEDLWAFNEERVAKAIYSCKIPIISAIGHEVDITIADYVADVRAPTPSAAAEISSPDQYALKQELDHHEERLHKNIVNTLVTHRMNLLVSQKNLRHPDERLAQYKLRFDQLGSELVKSQKQRLHNEKQKTALSNKSLALQNPAQLIYWHQQNITGHWEQLHKSILSKTQRTQASLQQQAKLLNTVSPLATLDRGYAIVHDGNNEIIRSAKTQKIGNTITAKLADGELTCKIDNIHQ